MKRLKKAIAAGDGYLSQERAQVKVRSALNIGQNESLVKQLIRADRSFATVPNGASIRALGIFN
ncbi:MAG: hypothetical protein ACFFCW_16250 [Candidatus Hodarchaeota archaeon]